MSDVIRCCYLFLQYSWKAFSTFHSLTLDGPSKLRKLFNIFVSILHVVCTKCIQWNL